MGNSNSLSNHDFRASIDRYINGGVFSKKDVLFLFFCRKIALTHYAKRFVSQYGNFKKEAAGSKRPSIEINIEPYNGKNTYVKKMAQYLFQHLEDELIGAYVHGSLGTYEEVTYSDFDGLVIIRDTAFDCPERLAGVARKLSNAKCIMYEFDPLQHHGWFILTEADLRSYPQNYFPFELFAYAKSLFPDQGLTLCVTLPEKIDSLLPFNNLADSILKKLEHQRFPDNIYQLKGLLSQFMLLPAFYVQVRDKKGIYKKYSFSAAKVDFSDEDWSVMDEVSSLRENWNYNISPLNKWLTTRPIALSRLLVKYHAPAIPFQINKNLSYGFYQKMKNLATIMKEKLT